ncbi:hypothetical protein JCM19047_1252 [Bacillus sp. JCM 19047]|uniref:sugar phosphate isomerase/epimerase family protein n=1 Tax=Shouchella miscanthi TaxID=2598861 RepID=UPI0003F0071F|nr:TIM barrel protein [Shouchella miscanthi]GAF21567.1 hypothetical protein JCM19047_1252 [Bacillus sp. JCM 19047]
MRYISLTTWSLNRLLGPLYWNEWDEENQKITTRIEERPAVHSLEELPQVLSQEGFHALEVIHPHFSSTDSHYLQRVRAAFEKSSIQLFSILVDYGDLSHKDPVRRSADQAFLKKWIDSAAEVGATCIRVIGGEARPDDKESLKRVSHELTELAAYGEQKGIGILTENFKSLTSTAENCLFLQNNSDIKGLITDFGNFSGQGKKNDIRKTLPYSKSIHVKALRNQDGTMNKAELEENLELVKQAKYAGPLTIVYDGPDDMWAGINEVKQVVEGYL